MLRAIFRPPEVTRKRNAAAAASRCSPAQRVHDVVEVRADDRVRAAEPLQGLEPQPGRPQGDLLVPEPLHDELQVGGLDPGGAARAEVRRGGVADGHAPAPHLLEHGVDELGLDLVVSHAVRQPLVERTDGLEHGVARGVLVEEVEVQVVAVDVRDRRLEALPEQRVGVLADRDEEVRAQVRPGDAAGQVVVEAVAGVRLLDGSAPRTGRGSAAASRRPPGRRPRSRARARRVAGSPPAIGRTASSSAAIRPAVASPCHALKTTGT